MALALVLGACGSAGAGKALTVLGGNEPVTVATTTTVGIQGITDADDPVTTTTAAATTTTSTTTTTVPLPDPDEELAEFDDLEALLDELDALLGEL